MALLTENLMNQLHHLKPSINKEQLQSAYSWENAKIVGCRGSCSGECGNGCTGACHSHCGAKCSGGCAGGCGGECATTCSGYCAGSCGKGCSGRAH